jgi:hypothetical protein
MKILSCQSDSVFSVYEKSISMEEANDECGVISDEEGFELI